MAKYCEACGRELQPDDRPKGGRPRRYCDKGCREFAAAISTFLKYASVVQERATPERWQSIRGRLFEIANARAWNRNVPGIGDRTRGKNGRFVAKGGA